MFLVIGFQCAHLSITMPNHVWSNSGLQTFRNRKGLVTPSGHLWTYAGLFHLCTVQSLEAGNSFEGVSKWGEKPFDLQSRIFVPAHFTTWTGELQIPSGGKKGSSHLVSG